MRSSDICYTGPWWTWGCYIWCSEDGYGAWTCTNKALADYWSADNQRLTIGRLPVNTESYKNLTFLLFWDRKTVVDHDPALRITVKPALGDHPFVKLKVVVWWRVTCWDRYCHYIIKTALTNFVNNNRLIPVIISSLYRLSAKWPIPIISQLLLHL